MRGPLALSKSDVRRAMVAYHFSLAADIPSAFERLRSVQFDPIAPVGCNHDLVLQARVPGYRIGDWHKTAYEDRLIYDGWDKQACLIPIEGWPVRRIYHSEQLKWFQKRIFEDHPEAVQHVLRDLAERGPLMPKEFEFQQRREEWKGSWYGPSVTKQTLRALWHSGKIMTAGRKNGQHLYDLTERIVPAHLLNHPVHETDDAVRELILERHRATGILRPSAPGEVWTLMVLRDNRKEAIADLVRTGDLVPVDVEGVKAHATPEFLTHLDEPMTTPRVLFVAPLDPFMWDRKMIAHVFGFDYTWEIYVPEAKRKWGYYVLPILFGDELVARAEFWCRSGVLELRAWHVERADLGPAFWSGLDGAIRDFMHYAKATTTSAREHIDPKMRKFFVSLGKRRRRADAVSSRKTSPEPEDCRLANSLASSG